jgi:holo-[acyl-carrier protein] synthase
MITGAGIDIIEISRVESACSKRAFLERVYTQAEIESCAGRASSLAGLFAAKEAAAKALGSGFRRFSPIDAEIVKDALGKPCLNPRGPMRRLMEEEGIRCAALSISHDRDKAVAFAVMESADYAERHYTE